MSLVKLYIYSAAFGATLAALALPTVSYAALAISTDATSNVTCDIGVCVATAKKAVLNVTDLTNLLAAGSLTVQSGNTAQDIRVEAPFSWTSSNALTFDSYRGITVDQSVSDAGPAALNITTNDGGTKGKISFGSAGNISFFSTANSFTINNRSYTLVDSVASLAAAVSAEPSGRYALSRSYDASQDGAYAHPPIQNTFIGTFEGLGNAISNLNVADTTDQYVGFFAQIGPAGTVSDFSLSNSSLNLTGNTASFESGTLAGINGGKVLRVVVSGTVIGCGVYLGGIAGDSYGEISGSSANVAVSAGSANCANVAGLAGANLGKISGSSATGDIDGGGGNAGGLVWLNYGLVEHSHTTGKVNSTPGNSAVAYIGGLVAENYGWITTSYATGAVSGVQKKRGVTAAGGLVGDNVAVISFSFATGDISGGPGSALGGAVGLNSLAQDSDPRVRDCYSTGSVNGGDGASVGGFVGIQDRSYAVHPIANSYSTGIPKAKKGISQNYVGGFAGADNSNNGTVASYWDTTTSGQGKGTGNRGNEPGLKGLTTSQLQSGMPHGFSPKIWAEDPKINHGYPYLIDNPPPK